jgi:hypothetical protein
MVAQDQLSIAHNPERPPLDPHVLEKIEARAHKVDQHHWPILIAMQVPNFHPLNVPLPPQQPLHLREAVLAYATELYQLEMEKYVAFRDDPLIGLWTMRLRLRVVARVKLALDRIEQGNANGSLTYHGLSPQELISAVDTHLLFGMSRESVSKAVETPAKPLHSKFQSTIDSPVAVRKMKAYMDRKGLDQTQFAIQAGTTDKTIRKFMHTGKVKRSILAGIAEAMGISKEELLSP